MPRLVDRSIARLIAAKRLFTAAASLMFAGALSFSFWQHPHALSPEVGVAVVLLVGGGLWSLRDGLRLRRHLAAPGASHTNARAETPADSQNG